uniref:PA domain-containing protein n=1 Tax=Salvator merianae TaxID=96440 RepID=A0A8D0DW96_SALMN
VHPLIFPVLFGPSLRHEGLLGRVVEAKPANACQPIRVPPPSNKSFVGFIALIQRYDCPFTTKVLHAQQAGYQAAIVYNINSQALVTMLSEEDHTQEEIRIPSLFISEASSVNPHWCGRPITSRDRIDSSEN